MTRTRRPFALALVALASAACFRDAPVGPRGGAVSLKVQFQTGSAGDAIHIAVLTFVPEREAPPDTLYQTTVQATTGQQTITAPLDLSRCLSNFAPDSIGPYCLINVDLQLLQEGTVVAEQFGGSIVVRPGQVAQTQPVILTAGNTPPTITSTDTARWVDPALLRYHITGTDPDGDITSLVATDIWNEVPDRTTTVSFYPPLGTIDGWYYAFETDNAGATAVQVYLSDSKYSISQIDTISYGFPNGDVGFVTDVIVDSTKDSVITQFHVGGADSAEIVVVSAALDSLYYVCGGSFVPDSTLHRVACGRPAAFTQALAIVVPFDAAGRPGNGTRCAIPSTDCQPIPPGDRVGRRQPVRAARTRAR